MAEHIERLNKDIKAVSETASYKCNLYTGDKYIVKAVTSQDDLNIEGKELEHCVASYGSYMASGNSYIYFIRTKSEPDKPLYTAELIPPDLHHPKDRYKLTQCYTYKDTTTKTDDLRQFILEWAKVKHISIKCEI